MFQSEKLQKNDNVTQIPEILKIVFPYFWGWQFLRKEHHGSLTPYEAIKIYKWRKFKILHEISSSTAITFMTLVLIIRIFNHTD